jgi:sterol desaturase/sphingolipid hydroxylase (fatty acid hydroxylase superfamily)
MTLLVIMAAIFASSGVLLAGLHLAFQAPGNAPRRIREEPQRKLKGTGFVKRLMVNATFSAALVFGATFGLYGFLFYESAPSPGRFVFEFFAVLLVYDFLYYLTHRYLFHGKWLHAVHAVHHTAKHPIAIDSLYLHPVETFIGLLLLFVSTRLVGPISVYSFGAIFLIYSHLNILLHCGLNLPGMAALNYMHRKHDHHHVSMKRGNFASITPLPDLLFRTAE